MLFLWISICYKFSLLLSLSSLAAWGDRSQFFLRSWQSWHFRSIFHHLVHWSIRLRNQWWGGARCTGAGWWWWREDPYILKRFQRPWGSAGIFTEIGTLEPQETEDGQGCCGWGKWAGRVRELHLEGCALLPTAQFTLLKDRSYTARLFWQSLHWFSFVHFTIKR